MKKQLLLFLITLLPIVASADDSGTCGDNLIWKYIESNHTLTISGTGEMYDYLYLLKHSPWDDYRKEIVSVIINDGVTSIGNSAFAFCTNLTKLTIPNSVRSISSNVLYNCSKIKTVTFPEGITVIKDQTFEGCTALESFSIPSDVTKIGYAAFSKCSSLTSVDISDKVVEIGSKAFNECSNLKSIIIPKSVNLISDSFKNCYNLKSVCCYAENVPKTSSDAFTYPSLSILYVPSGSMEAYKQAIPWKNFKKIVAIGSLPRFILTYKVDGEVYKKYEMELGSDITPEEPPVKEGYTFSGWSEIPSTMPDHDVTVTGSFVKNNYDVEVNGIYYNLIKKAKAAEVTNSSVKPYTGDIVIPSSFEYEGTTYTVTAIDEISGLKGNNTITSVIIPNTVTSIGEWAFYGCQSLKEISIPNSVTTIGEYAFSFCQFLTTVILPNGIQEIPENMFSQCRRLETIEIPYGVARIKENAFYACLGLKSIKIPFGLIEIDKSAFWKCTSLTTLELPTVMLIGEEAFKDCKNLSKVILGNYLVSIFSGAFSSCEELTDVYCYRDTVLSTNLISSDVFSGSQVKYATLHVLESLVSQYKRTSPWSEFGTIVALTNEETSVSLRRKEIDESVSRIYSIDGKLRPILQKGLNIVVQKDGIVKKLYVK